MLNHERYVVGYWLVLLGWSWFNLFQVELDKLKELLLVFGWDFENSSFLDQIAEDHENKISIYRSGAVFSNLIKKQILYFYVRLSQIIEIEGMLWFRYKSLDFLFLKILYLISQKAKYPADDISFSSLEIKMIYFIQNDAKIQKLLERHFFYFWL